MSTKQDVLHNSPQVRQNQEPQRQSFQDYQEMQQSEEAMLQDLRAELAAHKSGKPNKAGAEVPLAERDAAYYQRYPLEEIKDFYMGSPESRAQVLKAKGIEVPELPHTPITPVEERREDLVAVAQELVQEKQTPNAYEVQAGDRLEVIAAKFGVSVSALKAENADALQQWGNIEGFNAGATIEIPKTTSKVQGEQEAPKLSEVVKEPQAKSKKEEKAEDMKMLIGDQSVGDFTNLVEGDDNPDSLYFSRKAHWPGKKSGVTIGRGYDLGHRGTSTLIENEFKQAGIAISPWKSAIGLRGLGAKNWLEGNAAKLPIISHPQQNALFQLAFAEKKSDAKRMATKADVTAKYGATDWEKLNPMIKEMLFDLTYRGDYERDTREFLQPHVVKNDLEGFTKEMKNRSRWLKVSDDRFDQRVAFLEGRVKGLETSKDKTEEKAGTESAAKKAATPTISAGVGSGSAANNKADVLLIQARLHALGLLSPTAYADEKAKAEAVETAVDQKDLKATIAAIYKFQQQVLHWSSSDGNIGGASSKTLAELNGTACTAEYVKQRIEQYPQVKAEREKRAREKAYQDQLAADEAAKAAPDFVPGPVVLPEKDETDFMWKPNLWTPQNKNESPVKEFVPKTADQLLDDTNSRFHALNFLDKDFSKLGKELRKYGKDHENVIFEIIDQQKSQDRDDLVMAILDGVTDYSIFSKSILNRFKIELASGWDSKEEQAKVRAINTYLGINDSEISIFENQDELIVPIRNTDSDYLRSLKEKNFDTVSGKLIIVKGSDVWLRTADLKPAKDKDGVQLKLTKGSEISISEIRTIHQKPTATQLSKGDKSFRSRKVYGKVSGTSHWVNISNANFGNQLNDEFFGVTKAQDSFSTEANHKTIIDKKPILRIREDKNGVVSFKKTNTNFTMGDFVKVLNTEKDSGGNEYANVVKCIYDQEKGTYSEDTSLKGWTAVSNFINNWTDIYAPTAQWRKGEFQGHADIVETIHNTGQILLNSAGEAFLNMVDKAQKDSVFEVVSDLQRANPEILGFSSGFRTFSQQQEMNVRQKGGDSGINGAAPAGRSNHQSGVAFDLGNADYFRSLGYKTNKLPSEGMSAKTKKIDKWLRKNAPDFGFAITVSKPNEKHHWEYVGERMKTKNTYVDFSLKGEAPEKDESSSIRFDKSKNQEFKFEKD
ncbi:D-alanyl-D-alanine carboxypeptidase family protein [Persicobacter sp. CCB-QB2]|uniref:D-alanyl-D-alanine carboxypeptidase family protein n=1 Tax=Persicobacter sp. CCB-QB2 TaxID=1561025 RepID=UPI0006A97D96|nr:D-alanyl-D-alanine carboxypeptidase family protein [Persicobacter sp. CCB-QB2]